MFFDALEKLVFSRVLLTILTCQSRINCSIYRAFKLAHNGLRYEQWRIRATVEIHRYEATSGEGG
jgi:hypothetical protein